MLQRLCDRCGEHIKGDYAQVRLTRIEDEKEITVPDCNMEVCRGCKESIERHIHQAPARKI